MPLRIFLRDGIPHYFFAENGFSIDHGRDFSITSPQIKPDPASVQMSSERRGRFAGGGHLLRMDDFKGLLVNSAAHCLSGNTASGCFFIMGNESFVQLAGAVEINAITAPRPKQEFYKPLQI